MANQIGRESNDPLEWRDISPDDLRKEQGIRITLAVLAVILAAGMAVGMYYCATTSSVFPDGVVRSNMAYIVFPALLGGGGLTLLSLGVYFVNYEPYGGREYELPDGFTHKDIARTIKESTLEYVYNQYYKESGGLKALVRNEVLTPDQGRAMSALMIRYENYQKAEKLKIARKDHKDVLVGDWDKIKKDIETKDLVVK